MQIFVPKAPVGSTKKADDNWLKRQGVDPHEVKGNIGFGSTHDIFKDKDGNLWALRKNAPLDTAEYLGNLKDFKGN